jgi:glycosyltransferase involved in cell wall biosynthesis
VPFVLSAHGTLPRIDRLKLAKRAFDWVFGGRVYARARRWAAVTPLEAEQYRKAGIPEERIRIIGNGLDLEEFENLPAWGRFRGAHPGIGKDAKLLLAVSRLHKIKGLDFLIEGFSRLPPSPEGFRLAIVGPDEGERSRLRRLSEALGVADSVIFTGPLYSRDRLEAFVDADLFLSTSRYEITGLTSFEALMCGVPVIVTKESGQGRLIDASRAGYLVPFGDVHALTSAVRTALADKEDAARRVRAGQEYVRREMDWRLITDSWVALYREVVADSEAAGKGKDPAQGEADHPG